MVELQKPGLMMGKNKTNKNELKNQRKPVHINSSPIKGLLLIKVNNLETKRVFYWKIHSYIILEPPQTIFSFKSEIHYIFIYNTITLD